MAKGKRLPLVVATDRQLENAIGGEGVHMDWLRQLSTDWINETDHFWGDALDARYDAGISSGAGSAAPAIVAGVQGGVMRLEAGTADDGYSGFGIARVFAGDERPMFAARIKVNVATVGKLEVGFTDSLADVGAVNDLGAETARATDAAVFVWDADDTANIQCFGVKTNNTATKGEPGTAMDTSYHEYGVVIDNDDVLFFLDGKLYHRMTNGIEGGATITPWIFMQNRDGVQQHQGSVDWIRMQGRLAA